MYIAVRINAMFDYMSLNIKCWNTSFLFVDTFSGCDWTTDSWSCCSTSHPCGPLEGDCDSNEDCIYHLQCGNDNCFDSFSNTADCCYDPTPCKTTIYYYSSLSTFVNDSDTDKKTDVWSRDFIIWKINSGLWAVVWAGLWNKRV